MTPEQKKAIENKALETPLEDLRQSALNHYEEAADSIHHWSSFVVDAIKAYDPKRDEEVERLKEELSNEKKRYNDSIERNIDKREELDTLKKQVEELTKSRDYWHNSFLALNPKESA